MSEQKKNESLNDLLVSLTVLERQIDEAEEITQEMCEAHFGQLKQVDEKVDRLLAYIDIAKRNSALYEERAAELKEQAKRWDKRIEGLEKYALYLVDRFPDVSWRGTDRSFSKKLNPPSLVAPFRASYSSKNIIPDELVNMIPEKYRKLVSLFVLDTDLVKNDLKAGEALDFAKLERKEGLKITAKLKGDKT